MVCQTQGNTLVLFQYVKKQGIDLFKRIVELAKSTGRQVHYYAGSVNAESREHIRNTVAAGSNHIIVASYGTFQVGVNIPNLENLIFAHPAKSAIRVLQRIGRVLRKADGKKRANLFDLADDLRSGKYTNHVFKHATARMEYYSTEGFNVTEQEVDLARFALMAPPTAQDAPHATTVREDETQ